MLPARAQRSHLPVGPRLGFQTLQWVESILAWAGKASKTHPGTQKLAATGSHAASELPVGLLSSIRWPFLVGPLVLYLVAFVTILGT